MHVPMSLQARTVAQAGPLPAHVPMSPLGEDRFARVQSRMVWNSPEVSGRFRGFQRFLERYYRKVPEEVGIKYIGRNGTRPV